MKTGNWLRARIALAGITMACLPIGYIDRLLSAQVQTAESRLVTREVSLGRATLEVRYLARPEKPPQISWLPTVEERATRLANDIRSEEALKAYQQFGAGSLRISPESGHVAYGVARGNNRALVVDGVEGDKYERILAGSLFSPNGKRFAYAARRRGKWVVVVNGVESKEYDDIVHEPVFSPDSTRLAYAAERGGKCMVVVDGAEGKGYRSPVLRDPLFRMKLQYREDPFGSSRHWQRPIFSPDSKHVGYVARAGLLKAAVVVDGVEGKGYGLGTSPPLFSPDSTRVAYGAMVQVSKAKSYFVGGFAGKVYAEYSVVVDGVESGRYDELSMDGLAFSPDSMRVGYAAKHGGKWVVVADGVEGNAYDEIGAIVFSPDSKRLAYQAKRGKEWVVVVDGVEGKEWGGIPVFSPDSKRIAHVAVRGDKRILVLDGVQASELYDAITLPLFSPDGKRLAFAASRGTQWVVVADGVQGKDYDAIILPGPVFSPDGKRVAYVAQRAGKTFVVVDNEESKTYDSLTAPLFDGPTSLHAVALRDQEFFRVEIEIPH